MPPESLPTPERLGLIVHRLFASLRLQGLGGEVDPRELAEVADVAELIGLQFINRDENYLRIIIDGLRGLAEKYPRAGYYVAPLDMPDEEVLSAVRPGRSFAPAPALN